MCIAQLFVCFLAWLFAFLYCMYIRLFILFFSIVLCIISMFFFAKLLTFVFFVFLQTNPGVTCSIYEGFCRSRSGFFALTFVGSLHCVSLPFVLFSWNNFYVLLRSFCIVILCCDFVRFTPNLMVCFAFSVSFFSFVFLAPCLFMSTLLRALLTFPQFLLMIRHDQHDRHCSLYAFFDHLHAFQNTSCEHI